MDEIEKRLRETTDACIKSFENWVKQSKNLESREGLMEAMHEVRKVISRVEIEIARKSNPLDIGCERLMATGLCALRAWDKSFRLLNEVSASTPEPSYPDPLRTVPCLYYFRRGRYIVHAATEAGFNDLGSWEQFGELVNHCRAGACKACVYGINQVVDRLQPAIGVGLQEYVWEEKRASNVNLNNLNTLNSESVN